MERETKDRPAQNAEEVEQNSAEREKPSLPFASEGLEQLRDTHT